MANGMTRKKGKPTVKQMQGQQNQILDQVNLYFSMFQGRINELEAKVSRQERQLAVVDTRSAALSRLLTGKLVVTEAEMKEAMDAVFIDAFDSRVKVEDAQLKLSVVDEAIAEGTTYVVKFDTFENGERKASISSLRSQVQFGTGQLPKEFEAGVLGAKAGESRSFEIDAPAAFGPAYKGRKLTFSVDVLAVKRAPDPDAVANAEETAAVADARGEEAATA